MTNPLPLWLDISDVEAEMVNDVRWYSTADATDPLACTRCGKPIDWRAFSIGQDGATHDECDLRPTV